MTFEADAPMNRHDPYLESGNGDQSAEATGHRADPLRIGNGHGVRFRGCEGVIPGRSPKKLSAIASFSGRCARGILSSVKAECFIDTGL